MSRKISRKRKYFPKIALNSSNWIAGVNALIILFTTKIIPLSKYCIFGVKKWSGGPNAKNIICCRSDLALTVQVGPAK